MIRLATDEDFNNDIVRALRRVAPEVDILGVREAGHSGRSDPEILEWAATGNRVLLTHDVSTMTKHARERIAHRLPMPGLIAIHQRLPIGEILDDLVLVATCSEPLDWAGQIAFLPLR